MNIDTKVQVCDATKDGQRTKAVTKRLSIQMIKK